MIRRPTHARIASRSAGLTLIDSLIAVAVLAIGTAAVTETIVCGHMQTDDALRTQRAMMLADALMEEIISKPYDDPQGLLTFGPDTGETSRSLYDNIDDYHNFTDGPTGLKDAAASDYPSGFQGFTRSVSVAASSTSISGLPVAVSGLQITVTVTDAAGRAWALTRFVMEPPAGS